MGATPQIGACLTMDGNGNCTELNTIRFRPVLGGTYEVTVDVTLPGGDPLSLGPATATATATITVMTPVVSDGGPTDDGASGGDTAGGDSDTSGGSGDGSSGCDCRAAGASFGVAMLLVPLMAWRRRRRA